MKNFIKTIFFVYVFLGMNLSHAASNERIPLWGATYYGMTLNDVLATIVGAHSISDMDKAIPTPQALAKLDDVEIAGEHFNAWFIFNAGKLKEVTLTLDPKSTESKTPVVNSDLSVLNTLYTRLLSIKYGNPIAVSLQIVIPPTLPSGHTQWVSGMTNIDLNFNNSKLDISYGAQYANDLRNL